MTKFRKSIIAAIATAVMTTSVAVSFDSAKAGPRGMRAAHGEMFNGGHRGHRGFGHRRHGGMGGFGTAMAIGLGVSALTSAIAAAAAEDSDERIHRDAGRQGWTARNQRRHDCHLVREYKKLVRSAEEALARDIRMNKQYPQHHSFEHVNFSRKELQRRRNELRRAQARCA